MTDQSNKLAVWQKGVPLDQALYEFGNPEAVERLEKLEEQPKVLPVLEAVAFAINKQPFDNSVPVKRLSAAQRSMRAIQELKQEIWEDLRDQIISRELIVTGYAVPRTPKDPPVVVPEDVVESGIGSHEGGVLEANSLKFVSVRVTQMESDPSSEQIVPKKKGRPSVKNDIIETVLAMASENSIDLELPNTDLCNSVRTRLLVECPQHKLIADRKYRNEPYPSDKTLERDIGEAKRIWSARTAKTKP